MRDCRELMLGQDWRRLRKMKLIGLLLRRWPLDHYFKMDTMWEFQGRMLREVRFLKDMPKLLIRLINRLMYLYQNLNTWNQLHEADSQWIILTSQKMVQWDSRLDIQWNHQKISCCGRLNLEIFITPLSQLLTKWWWAVNQNGFDKSD